MATETAERAEGLDAGREWATTYAEYEELRNLSNWWETNSESDRELILTTDETDAFGASHAVACIILGNENADRHDCEEFWDAAIGDDDDRRYSDVFVRSFVEGALEVWDSVKDQI